jgi:RNA polymerase sigma-70 factor (ECF subfamily)
MTSQSDPFSHPSTISTTLLGQVRRWDSQGWQRMVRIFGPLVYFWGRRAGLQAHDAADLVQDVFRSVLMGIEGFRRDRPRDSFRGWLNAITQNRIRDHYRRRQRQPQAVGGGDNPFEWQEDIEPMSHSSADGCQIETSLVGRALAAIEGEFEPRTWSAFWKTVVENKAAQETAIELDMTAGAVRQAKYRILLRLRRELEQSI